jgi:hypothetical protein
MIKYLVFKNEPSSGKSNVLGSPEDVACDIAGFVEGDGNPKTAFIAFPAETPEATFATLKLVPRFSVALDQKKIDVWTNDANNILNKIHHIDRLIEDSYLDIMGAIDQLEYAIKKSAAFQGIDILSEIDIWSAFEEMEKPTDHDFSRYVSEYFEVERIVF